MNIILFDNKHRNKLFPLTQTRAVAALRMGLFTMQERWQHISDSNVYVHTENYLQPLYNTINFDKAFWIDASVLPTETFVKQVFRLHYNDCLVNEKEEIIAFKFNQSITNIHQFITTNNFNQSKKITVQQIEYAWNIFQLNEVVFKFDWNILIQKKQSNKIDETVAAIEPQNIFIEEGAVVKHCILNASTGNIYIGKNAVVQEGGMIRGPFALGKNSVVKMGAKIYGATSIGNNCVVGGEIKNVVMQGNSNKAHDGYLGDSVIGEWCNFGAGTSNSNVKNTGGIVNVWNDAENAFLPVAQKCGLIMGDYSKTAINTSINTGSVVGVCCNVYGKGLMPKHIKNFTFNVEENITYSFDKALQEISNWKAMKHQILSNEEIDALKFLLEKSA